MFETRGDGKKKAKERAIMQSNASNGATEGKGWSRSKQEKEENMCVCDVCERFLSCAGTELLKEFFSNGVGIHHMIKVLISQSFLCMLILSLISQCE